jgi:hypothetical protein
MLTPTIDARELKRALAIMKQFDPELRKFFIRDMKSGLKPIADDIAQQVPKNAPLTGFGTHRGRTSWSPVKASVNVTPASRKSLARIEVFGQGAQQAALKITDLAGTRGSFVKTRNGRKMIDSLSQRYPLSANGRGGRFVWRAFMENRPQMLHFADKVLTKYSNYINQYILRSGN